MLRLLPMLLILALALFAVIDCLSRDEEEIRGLPKVLWVLVILLFPLLGSLAWFIAGRPRGAKLPGTGFGSRGSGSGGERHFGLPGGPGRPGVRPVAPDDDPEFLRRLDEQRRRRRPDEEEPKTDA
jgi:hypothetical protein